MAHGQHDYEKIKNGKFFSFMLIGAFSILLSAVVLLFYLLSKIPQLGETGIWISIPIGWFLADAVGIIHHPAPKKKIAVGAYFIKHY
jgi:hypothetical protein